MSGGMLFVLHGSADEAYASALAAELGAMTLPLQARATSLQFGSGAICVVVWSAAMQSEGVLATLPFNSIICRLNAATPRALDAFSAINATGSPTDDAVVLCDMVAALQAATAENVARLSNANPRLGAAATDTVQRKPPLAMRSAYGMAATLAVAGFIAPTIMERAQASGPETASAAEPTSAPTSGADLRRAALLAVAEQTSAAPEAVAQPPAPMSSTPALDNWLSDSDESDVDETVAAITAVAFQRSPEPVAEALTPEITIDPKRALYASQTRDNEKERSNPPASIASLKDGAPVSGAAALP